VNKRKELTQKILKSISRTCKRRICDNVFTPKNRKDQVFCSERCADIQGKEDWKKRNKKKYLAGERRRKKEKYSTDKNYSSKLKQRSKKRYHSLSDDQKFERNKKNREREDPIKRRKYHKNYQNKRNKEDINHRLAGSLRARVRAAIKRDKTIKSFSTMKLVGCTIEELKKHLQSQFDNKMSWQNYGSWHIDHKKAVSKFDLTNSKEQKKCFNYKNLQPLWGTDNLRKSNR
tara:strand:- start:93 stop:785 length:693 start_codon:yes stop_codon:yes gene_type:complete